MGFTSILIDDRDRTGKKVDNNVRKNCEKDKSDYHWFDEKKFSTLVVNFIDGKIMEKWNSSWSFFSLWSFLIAVWKNTANKFVLFFLLRHFFHSFLSLAISAHCSLLDLLINIIWNFIITILKHILHFVQVVGIVTFLFNQCLQVSMGLDFSYLVHLQHHQGFLSYNPQISF